MRVNRFAQTTRKICSMWSLMLTPLFSLALLLMGGSVSALAQTQPNLQNGFSPQGSYAGSSADTVNLMNGNLTLHIPIPVYVPQRGKLGINYYLVVNAKTWIAYPGVPTVSQNQWQPTSACGSQTTGPCGQGPLFVSTASFGLTRIYEKVWTDGQLPDYSVTPPDTLVTWDGAGHSLSGALETMDTSGYSVQVFGSDNNGLPYHVIITSRDGTQYSGSFSHDYGTCVTDPGNGLPGSTQTTTCSEHFILGSVTDANGNVLSPPLGVPDIADPMAFGPTLATHQASSAELTGCITSFGTPWIGYLNYPGPNGQTNQIKLCFGTYPQLSTSFSPAGIHQFQDVYSGHPFPQGYRQPVYLTNVVLPDNTQWSLSYDSYGEMTSLGTPTGAGIQYSWTEGQFPVSSQYDITSVSRAVHSRTVTDVSGNSFTWNYQWGAQASDGTMSHTVTNPRGDDTVHVFAPIEAQATAYPYNFKEISTVSYQGSGGSRTAQQQVDTTWQIKQDGDLGVPTDTKTTMFASQKVSLVHRDYDSSSPTLGLVTAEKHYDWGQGAPGSLLREEDTVYQWQNDSRYLTANILDLPASVVVKDPAGNKMAETDFTYDEAAYLTSYEGTVGALPAGSDVAAPNPVRGNPSTISKWLNTGVSVVSHANWYDTGEVYQAIDPLGHTVTHSYDLAYNGALSTKTCNALSQCVSGTYDANTGLLTSFTDANAGSSGQASGNTPGNAAHTSTYTYDLMGRLASATAPADASGNHPQTTVSYPNPTTVQRVTSITPNLTYTVTSYSDGLGKIIRTQQATPNGNATVDTTYDGLGHAVSVTNPYFSTSDPTYGVIRMQYDALGRPTQVTKQDGSISTVAYNYVPVQAAPGDCTKSTDEAGKQRLACGDGLGRLIEVHEPGDNFSGSQAQGSFNLTGNLQTHTIPGTNATPSTGSVTINGSEQALNQSTRYCAQYDENGDCVDWEIDSSWGYDAGVVTITVNGHSDSYSYGSGDSSSSVAAGLKTAINNDGGAFVTASVSGSTISLASKATGTAANYSLSSSYTYDTTDFTSPSFTTGNSGGALSGGTNGTSPTTVYDSGTVTVTVGSFTASASYSQSGNSTAALVAAALAGSGSTGLSRSGSPVTASASGSTITINYATMGSAVDVSVGCNSSTGQGTYFSSPSFTCPATTALNGGANPEGASLDFNYFITQYSYDALGNMLSVTQKGDPTVSSSSQWRVRTFTYDSLSRLRTATNPESGTITYSFDAGGNLLQKTSPAPNQPQGSTATQTISFCYDQLNRVTGKAYSAQSCPLRSPVVTYSYDGGTNGIGHLTSLSDQAGSGSYTFDALGRISSEQRTINPGAGLAAVSKNLAYTYNLDNSVATLTYPSGAVVTYMPDSAGRILSAIDSGSNISYVTGATYGPDGGLTGFVSGASGSFAGITNSFSYNNRLQPVNMSASSPTATVFSLNYDFHLGNGDNGNVYGITNNRDTTRNQAFTYDALNRLTSAQNAGTDCIKKTANNLTAYWGNTYGYDAWGNLLQKTVTKCGAENLSVSALANNQLSGYSYDASGNMIHDATTGNNYSYDQENRITGAAGYTYTYDADGARVEKSNGSTGTIYWYMSPGIVAESDLTGTLKSEYIFFDGDRVARKDLSGSTTAVSYYFSDHLKTAAVVTDSAGIIKEDEDFYPWGGELQFVNNDSNHYKFTSKERDSETGLDYFGARYYGNWLGRFITPDWAAIPVPVPYADLGDPQSLNQYSYVRNIPTSQADEDGHQVQGINESDGDDALRPKRPSDCPGLSDCRTDDIPPSSQHSCGFTCWIGGWFAHKVNPDNFPAQGIPNPIWNQDQAAENALRDLNGAAGALNQMIEVADITGLTTAVKELMSGHYAKGMMALVLGFVPGGTKAEEAVTVYRIVEEGKTVYVGITNNIARRGLEHGATLERVATGLTRAQARGVEQVLIEHYGFASKGGSLRNRINSISRTRNRAFYNTATAFGKAVLDALHFQY